MPAADTIIDLERIAAAHWRAPEQELLGEWLLRAADGFTGRANSALPLGDPGMPLADAVTEVTAWYRDRGLPPMIAVPQPLHDAPSPLEIELAERKWVPRPAPAFVMTARISDIPPPSIPVRLTPEPDETWCRLYRYRSQPLPPVARTLLMSAPWQAFATIRPTDLFPSDAARPASEKGTWGPRTPSGGAPWATHPPGTNGGGADASGAAGGDADGAGGGGGASGHDANAAAGGDADHAGGGDRSEFGASADAAAVAVGRVSVDGDWAGITAVEVDAAWRRRGLATAITAALCAAAAQRGVTRVFLQVETGNSAARALYIRCGFRDSHRYHYLIAPRE